MFRTFAQFIFKMNFSRGAGRCTKCFRQFQRGGGFIFILKNGNSGKVWALIWNSLYGTGMDFFWNRTFLVANFQDLVAKVENLVALVPVLGAISFEVVGGGGGGGRGVVDC